MKTSSCLSLNHGIPQISISQIYILLLSGQQAFINAPDKNLMVTGTQILQLDK